MTWFWIGLGVGVLLTIPLAAVAANRAAQRVRRLSERARSAERLAGLGALTGGLAHEIKNPLSTVGLNIQLIEEDLEELAQAIPADAPAHDQLGRVQRRFESLSRETQRLRTILEDFLRFAGRVKLDRTPTDLNALVGELADFFAPQAQAGNVNLRTQLSPQPPLARIDAGLMKQAVLNLLINATQAMTEARDAGKPHGGCDELIVRTERIGVLRGDEVRIHVTDTGPGIAADEIDRVLQPYFSTKRGGTGLGLPTARRIVEEHGGTLAVHSETGRGTDFTISIPLSKPDDGPSDAG